MIKFFFIFVNSTCHFILVHFKSSGWSLDRIKSSFYLPIRQKIKMNPIRFNKKLKIVFNLIRFNPIKLIYCLIELNWISFSKIFASAFAIGSNFRLKMLPSDFRSDAATLLGLKSKTLVEPDKPFNAQSNHFWTLCAKNAFLSTPITASRLMRLMPHPAPACGPSIFYDYKIQFFIINT